MSCNNLSYTNMVKYFDMFSPLRFYIHVKTGKNDSDLQFILSLYRKDIFLFHFQLTRVLSNIDLLGIYREMAHVMLGTDANLDLK